MTARSSVELTVVLERRRHGRLVAPDAAPRQGLPRLLRGPWPLVAGAVALALLNFATLALAYVGSRFVLEVVLHRGVY